MATESPLDIDQLVAPISDDSPTGDEFRSLDSNAYWDLRRLRDRLKKEEERAFFADDTNQAAADSSDDKRTWNDLLNLCVKAVSTKSKDIQLVAWMLEALPRVHGFAGLNAGLQILQQLTQRYLPKLHPQPETEGEHEDGIYTCLQPIDSLDQGPLIEAVGRIDLTLGDAPAPYSVWQYEQANDLAKRSADEQERKVGDGWISLGMFSIAASQTPADFAITTYADLKACEESLQALESELETSCGEQDGQQLVPSTRNLRNKLSSLGIGLRALYPALASGESSTPDPTPTGPGTTSAPQTISTVVPNQPPRRTRDTAFRELEDIAKFFRDTEPHSIISYQIDQAIRYGRMALPDLLKELLSGESDSVLQQLYRHVGIQRKDDN